MSEEFGDAFGDEESLTTSSGHGNAEPEPQLVYSSAVEFFVELLAQSYVREVNEGAAFAWCPEWYKHPEALIRMEAIWRAWEHLRLEPALGVSTWWLNHADPHMRILMDKEGPFKKCAYDGHKPPTPEKAVLPHIVPEAGIFDEQTPVVPPTAITDAFSNRPVTRRIVAKGCCETRSRRATEARA